MSGWSTPSAVGSASDGGWRSFQPLSHASADAGESATPVEERGRTSGGDRGMGVDVDCGVESNGERGVEHGAGRGAIITVDCGMERGGMMLCEMTQTWKANVVAIEQVEKITEGAEVGGVQLQQEPLQGSTSFGTVSSTNTTTCPAGIIVVENINVVVNRHVDENGHMVCSLVGAPDPTAPLDHVMIDVPARLTNSACSGMGLETERRTVTPLSTPFVDPVQGGSNLRCWKCQTRARYKDC
ncbi:hypothetical protein FH972_008422 [Carpinus fangiana]|uniref:Uncharacterized protein n=1 Tax=Carpinus fangiana TaxID=176857 RepID=A0A5N6QYP4_9ROSI|nr:hypothetical protein FH972_008422 [Carpinus fangiana]